ncbi:MAG: hypothetical protein HRU15_02820 [Planctomycetes bacterium]|nr:hypothetical protein [Planctomycetota bacterium]
MHVIRIFGCYLILWVLLLSSAEQDIFADYSSTNSQTTAILEHFHNIYSQQYNIDSKLLSYGIPTRAVNFSLRQADSASAMQALCHALGDNIWWHSDKEHNFIISKKNHTPIKLVQSSIDYPSTIEKPQRYYQLLSDVLSPWILNGQGGFSIIENKQLWIANLCKQGHSDLKQSLRILEQGSSTIPPRSLQLPPQIWPLTKDIHGTSWQLSLNELAQNIKCSISLSQTLSHKKQKIHIKACLVKDLTSQLIAHGIQARWIAGVLCCDTAALVERQHSASQRHIVGISLKQFSGREQQKKIVQYLQKHIIPAYWQRTGCVIAYIPERQVLFLAAHDSAISAILGALRDIDSPAK